MKKLFQPSKKLFCFIIFIFAFVVLLIGSTYAYQQLGATSNTAQGQGGCFQVNYTGQNLDAGSIVSTDNYLNGAYTTITLSKNSTCKIYTEANIYLHTNNETTAPIDTTEAMRYKLVTNDNVEYNGFVKKSCDVLIATIPITNTSITYDIYVWVDSNLSEGAYHGTTYSGYIYAESSQTSTIDNQDSLPNSDKCQSSTRYMGFSYTGKEQTYIIPKTGTYKMETWGAQGGSATYNSVTYQGGNGGYSVGNKSLSKGDKVYIYVGEQGGSATGNSTTGSSNGKTGYNGGGFAAVWVGNSSAGGGGGATHIATVTGLLKNLSNNKSSVIIVAGAGGGGKAHTSKPNYSGTGGIGGGLTGGTGVSATNKCYNIGMGASQSATGGHQKCQNDGKEYGIGNDIPPQDAGFGLGANYTEFKNVERYAYAGGGAGYYGGAAGYHAPAGGGSSYIGGVTDGSTIAGDSAMPTHDGSSTMVGNSGNGYAKITFIG